LIPIRFLFQKKIKKLVYFWFKFSK